MSFQKHVNVSGVFTFLFIFTFFSINQLADWPLLRFWNVRGARDFADLYSVLCTADYFKVVGLEVYEIQTGEGCQNYIYGSWLLRILNFFHLGSSSTTLLGWVGLLTISIILSTIIHKNTTQLSSTFIIYLSLALSPPIMLLVERGNIDWLVFACVYLGAVSFSKGQYIIGILVLALSALFKFYAFPLMLLCFILIKRPIGLMLATLITILTFIQLGQDFVLLRSVYVGSWFASFGNNIWGQYLSRFGLELTAITTIGLGLLCTGVIFLILNSIRPIKEKSLGALSRSGVIDYSALFAVTIVIVCYFAGLNYDYRLVFLFPTLQVMLYGAHQRIRFLIVTLFLASFWLSFNSGYLQPIGDLAINVIVVVLVSIVILPIGADKLTVLRRRRLDLP